jgi:hypothetical protein
VFIQVSEETVINVVNDLETRLAEADGALERQRADSYAVRTKLYEAQDRLVETTNRLQHEARIACTQNHFPSMGKIPMIRALRELYPYLMGDENAKLGLKEAKDAVDAALAAGKLPMV